MDVEQARAYIETVRWQFAKTMPAWPHEYTVKAWRPQSFDAFESFCQLIVDTGVVDPWPPPPAAAIYRNHYVDVGPFKYWAMGPLGDRDPVHGKTVINRARVPASAAMPGTRPSLRE